MPGEKVSPVMFCKQFLSYLCTLIGAIILSINIQVGLNMHLYDDIGDASSSLRGSTSSCMKELFLVAFRNVSQISSRLNVASTLIDSFQKIDGEVRKEVDEAVKVSKSDKEIPLQELAADVYYEPLETEIRGTTPFAPYSHQRIAQPFNAH